MLPWAVLLRAIVRGHELRTMTCTQRTKRGGGGSGSCVKPGSGAKLLIRLCSIVDTP